MNWIRSFFNRHTSPNKVVPIIEDYNERGIENEYRRPDDPEHVIRVNQNQPKGCPRKLKNYVQVVGVSRSEYRVAVESFITGTNRRVMLERDKDNPIDSNAIKVIGAWVESDNIEHVTQLGWVPKDIASTVVTEVGEQAIGATLEAMFQPQANKSGGIRIAIWGPRRTKEDLRSRAEQRLQNRPAADYAAVKKDVEQPGYFQGRHYSDYSDEVKDLKLTGNLSEMELLLLHLVDATEEQNRADGLGVAPWYYEELAKLYRKQRDHAQEVAILQRFVKQQHAPGTMPAKLKERLKRAQELEKMNR